MSLHIEVISWIDDVQETEGLPIKMIPEIIPAAITVDMSVKTIAQPKSVIKIAPKKSPKTPATCKKNAGKDAPSPSPAKKTPKRRRSEAEKLMDDHVPSKRIAKSAVKSPLSADKQIATTKVQGSRTARSQSPADKSQKPKAARDKQSGPEADATPSQPSSPKVKSSEKEGKSLAKHLEHAGSGQAESPSRSAKRELPVTTDISLPDQSMERPSLASCPPQHEQCPNAGLTVQQRSTKDCIENELAAPLEPSASANCSAKKQELQEIQVEHCEDIPPAKKQHIVEHDADVPLSSPNSDQTRQKASFSGPQESHHDGQNLRQPFANSARTMDQSTIPLEKSQEKDGIQLHHKVFGAGMPVSSSSADCVSEIPDSSEDVSGARDKHSEGPTIINHMLTEMKLDSSRLKSRGSANSQLTATSKPSPQTSNASGRVSQKSRNKSKFSHQVLATVEQSSKPKKTSIVASDDPKTVQPKSQTVGKPVNADSQDLDSRTANCSNHAAKDPHASVSAKDGQTQPSARCQNTKNLEPNYSDKDTEKICEAQKISLNGRQYDSAGPSLPIRMSAKQQSARPISLDVAIDKRFSPPASASPSPREETAALVVQTKKPKEDLVNVFKHFRSKAFNSRSQSPANLSEQTKSRSPTPCAQAGPSTLGSANVAKTVSVPKSGINDSLQEPALAKPNTCNLVQDTNGLCQKAHWHPDYYSGQKLSGPAYKALNANSRIAPVKLVLQQGGANIQVCKSIDTEGGASRLEPVEASRPVETSNASLTMQEENLRPSSEPGNDNSDPINATLSKPSKPGKAQVMKGTTLTVTPQVIGKTIPTQKVQLPSPASKQKAKPAPVCKKATVQAAQTMKSSLPKNASPAKAAKKPAQKPQNPKTSPRERPQKRKAAEMVRVYCFCVKFVLTAYLRMV